MNSKLDLIFKRRSVRKYDNSEISDDQVRDLLEAGMAAPSACAKDPWRFIVVKDRERLQKISDGLPNGKMLAEAAVGIVVCGDMYAAHGGELSYMLQDCGAAIQNIMLAATALGLGTCWLGVHPREDRISHIRKLLHVPSNMIPMSVIAVGWPAEQPEPRTRYDKKKIVVESF